MVLLLTKAEGVAAPLEDRDKTIQRQGLTNRATSSAANAIRLELASPVRRHREIIGQPTGFTAEAQSTQSLKLSFYFSAVSACSAVNFVKSS